MGAILVKGYIDLDKVKATGKVITTKKGGKALAFDCWVNDEKGNYGDNGGAYISQTQEDREAGNTKEFVGNLTVAYHADKEGAFDPKKATVKKEEATTGTDDDW